MSKVTLITGASRGIGKEIALTFARKGARVFSKEILLPVMNVEFKLFHQSCT